MPAAIGRSLGGAPLRRAARPVAAISTLISLFLLLLVFFITLVASASIGHRPVAEIIGVVDRALGGVVPVAQLLAAMPEAVPDPRSPAGFLDAASRLLTGFEARAGQGTDAGATLLSIAVPAEPFFARGTDQIATGQRPTLASLAVMMQRTPDPDHRYLVRIEIEVPDGDAPSAAAEMDLGRRRAAMLAGALFEGGCPPDRIEIVARAGAVSAARLHLAFRLAGPGTPASAVPR